MENLATVQPVPGKRLPSPVPERGAIEVEHCHLTPTRAQALLDTMGENRRPNDRHIKMLANDIREGFWKFTGQPIIINEFGALIDGQHRCQACVMANNPIEVLIVSGVRQACFDAIDQGKKRGAADIISIGGSTENASHIAAAIAYLLPWYADGILDGRRAHSELALSNVQIAASEPLFPQLIESVRLGRRARAKLFGNNAIHAACHYVFARRDRELADSLYEHAITGENIQRGDPAYAMRERLLAIRMTEPHRRTERARDIMSIVIHAWNASRRGQRPRTLRGMVNGSVPKIL